MSLRVFPWISVALCALSMMMGGANAGVDITSADGFRVEWDGNDGDNFDPTPPPRGSVVPDNLALASNGATPIASGELGPELNIQFHVTENLNDGLYGNSNSWIGGTPDEEPWFGGVAFGGLVEIGAVAWGRDNGNGEWDDSASGTDACDGQCDDRSEGLYELQITSDANPGPESEWTTVAELDYFSDDTEPGGDFTSYFRHQYSIARTNGSPVEATGVRVLVPATGLSGGTAIDEIEVYGPPPAMQLVEEGGEMAESNVALGQTAFAKDLINGGGFAAHQIPHINDGIFGNSNSWIGASEGSFVGVSFGESSIGIQSLAFGRDNTGQFTDRAVGTYVVQFTDVANPDETTPDDDWETLETLDYSKSSALLTAPHLRHRYNFEEIDATGVRIITFNGACIDELEVYIEEGDIVAPPPTIAAVEEGGEIAEGNLAQGGTAFAKDVINGGGFAAHQITHLNDGMYSNDFSWIGDSAESFAGINLGATNVMVRSFAFGRDNTGAFADRAIGVYTVQVTQMPNPDNLTPDSAWTTIGIVNLQAGDPANPALRHRFNIEAVEITGLRIITPGAGIGSGAAIDELEVYGDEFEPPPPEAIEISPAAGFEIAWDGNDGDHFDITPPEDGGAAAPENLALASNGALPIGSSELGPELNIAYHIIPNINDGIYGNVNSWISASGDQMPFIGVAFGGSVDIQRIAWGRDNGNGAIDGSDPGTDACGGQCTDRSLGVYEIQITTITNPDSNTPNGDWTTIGTINYLESQDNEIGEAPTTYLRHEYAVSAADDGPVTATGLRILVPTAGLGGGTAIDEIEVYGVEGDRVLRPIEEGGEFAEDNLAPAGTAFAFDLLGDGSFAPTHTIENVNNGSYGNASSWIGNSENSFVGINLGANPVKLASIAFGRDNTGSFSDRSIGTYTLQYTATANPDKDTPADQWMTIGEIVLAAGNPANPQLRHRFNFPEVMATGIRLFTPGNGIASGAAIDEIELYEDALIVIPPPPEALEITPAEGFEVTWDGNDGDNFDPVSPDDGGSVVPDNLALASNGATAFGSGELGVDLGLDFHLFPNANDGLYGNSNSWIGNSEPQFIGIDFGGSFEMSRIAWGRDNGNGEWDGSDPGTDACGGQCNDRNRGVYTLQFTTVSDPDESTDDADWVTIGEFNYKLSNDDEPGGEFTSHLRHEYGVTTAAGEAISATGIRILSPNGTAIDEIEVYGAARDPFLTFDDGNEVSFTFDNLDVQFIGLDFENQGAGEELVISSISFEGNNADSFSLLSELEPVAAGAAGGIVINFDPKGASGVFTADAVVSSNDSLEPEQRISITVQVDVEGDPDKDTDGDGVPDVKEIAAGTDPNDASSFFAATSVTQSDGATTLEWSSVDGRTYSVQFSDTLQVGSWQQVPGAEAIAATAGGTTSFTIPATEGVDVRWFRVLVQ